MKLSNLIDKVKQALKDPGAEAPTDGAPGKAGEAIPRAATDPKPAADPTAAADTATPKPDPAQPQG